MREKLAMAISLPNIQSLALITPPLEEAFLKAFAQQEQANASQEFMLGVR
jgi:hypothetical protein